MLPEDLSDVKDPLVAVSILVARAKVHAAEGKQAELERTLAEADAALSRLRADSTLPFIWRTMPPRPILASPKVGAPLQLDPIAAVEREKEQCSEFSVDLPCGQVEWKPIRGSLMRECTSESMVDPPCPCLCDALRVLPKAPPIGRRITRQPLK